MRAMQERVLTLRSPSESQTRTDEKSERALIRMAQAGDIRAFERLVKLYQQRVISLVYRIVGNPEDARDVAQVIFIRVYRFLSQYRNEKRFFTWLYRIAINASYDFLKKKNRYRSVPLEDVPTNAPVLIDMGKGTSGEINEKICELAETLSTPQKSAFILREVEGFSNKEIARIMKCPEGTIRSHLHHARKQLRNLLEKHYPELLEGIVS